MVKGAVVFSAGVEKSVRWRDRKLCGPAVRFAQRCVRAAKDSKKLTEWTAICAAKRVYKGSRVRSPANPASPASPASPLASHRNGLGASYCN